MKFWGCFQCTLLFLSLSNLNQEKEEMILFYPLSTIDHTLGVTLTLISCIMLQFLPPLNLFILIIKMTVSWEKCMSLRRTSTANFEGLSLTSKGQSAEKSTYPLAIFWNVSNRIADKKREVDVIFFGLKIPFGKNLLCLCMEFIIFPSHKKIWYKFINFLQLVWPKLKLS